MSPTRGFGLAEVLVASGLGIVIGMASLDSMRVAIRTAQTVKTDLEEQRLSHAIKNYFSSEANCKNTLKPSKLSETDRANQAGLILNSEGTALKQIGSWSSNLIAIQRIELLNEGTDKSYPHRILAVLYTKPYLRGHETLGDGDCSATDNSGCYYHTCVVEYECSDDECAGDDDKCLPLTCHNGRGVQSVSCEEGEYLSSFKANGEKVCEKVYPCEPEEGEQLAFLGFSTGTDGSREPICEPIIYAPQPSEQIACPDGQVVKRIKHTGELECTGLCGARQRWNSGANGGSGACECVSGTQLTGTSPNKSCDCPNLLEFPKNGVC